MSAAVLSVTNFFSVGKNFVHSIRRTYLDDKHHFLQTLKEGIKELGTIEDSSCGLVTFGFFIRPFEAKV